MADVSLDDKRLIAFFDVDETLINSKSMFDFMQFFLKSKKGKVGVIQFKFYKSVLKSLAFLGLGREKVNKFYYQLYRGEKYKDLMEIGEEWYEARKTKPSFFMQPAIDRLQELKKSGYEIAFVSGSFRPCLEPLARDLNIKTILCGELELVDGKITGRMTQQCIGEHKAKLVKRLARSRNVRLKDCFAFGDHVSDFPMLNVVGHPIVVPNCKALIEIADRNKWEILN